MTYIQKPGALGFLGLVNTPMTDTSTATTPTSTPSDTTPSDSSPSFTDNLLSIGKGIASGVTSFIGSTVQTAATAQPGAAPGAPPPSQASAMNPYLIAGAVGLLALGVYAVAGRGGKRRR